jgi:hypothetical protein
MHSISRGVPLLPSLSPKANCNRHLKWTITTSYIHYVSPIIRDTVKRVENTKSEEPKNLIIKIICQYLGEFAILRKAITNYVMSVCPSASK